MSTPKSSIYVCSGVALNSSYSHTIYFESKEEQTAYFTGKVVKTFLDYTYLRRNWDIKIDATIDSAQFWNYLYFKNPDGKTYYYFINSVEYKSEASVVLHLEMDVMQTYLFDWELKPCFIDRMTPASDEVGENTIEEGLEVGELINANRVDVPDLNYYYLMVMSTADLGPTIKDQDGQLIAIYEFKDVNSTFIGEIYSGCRVYCIDADSENLTEIQQLFDALNEDGKTDAIVSMWMFPKNLVDAESVEQGNFKIVTGAKDVEITYNKPSALGTYIPKNRKLFSYPFSFLHVHNNMGASGDFRFERFNGDIVFNVYGSIFPDGGIKAVPANYNGVNNDYETGITLTGFPTCSWNNDTYKIWLAQNQNQIGVNVANSAITGVAGVGMIVGGALTANPALAMSGASMAYSGVSSIGSQLAQISDMKTVPDQARGSQSSSINALHGKMTFSFYHKCVTPERARIIDDYFTMYGYKQNIVDTPSIYNRQLHTYIKTIGSNVAGEICNDDKNKINAIFDRGITFWTDGDMIGDYNEANPVFETPSGDLT